MFRDRFFLLPLVAVFFILGACQSEGKLTGEVFIVTEGRENIEMGLVDVKAIRADSVKNYLQGRYGRAQQEVKARASEIETLLDSLASLSLSDSGIQSVEAYTLDSGRRASVGERVLTLPGEAGIDLGKTRQGYVTLTEPTTGTVVSVKDFGFYEIDFGKFSGQVKGDKLMRMVDYRKITGISDVEEKANDKFEDIKGVISQDYYYRDMLSPRSSSETGSDANQELRARSSIAAASRPKA